MDFYNILDNNLRRPFRVNGSAADRNEVLPPEIFAEIERLNAEFNISAADRKDELPPEIFAEIERLKAEFNNNVDDDIDNIFIHHGRSGSHIFGFSDLELNAALDTVPKKAGHYDIGPPGFNSNQLEHFNGQWTMQQQQFPLSIYHWQSNSQPLGDMVGSEYPGSHIFGYNDPEYSPGIDMGVASNATHYGIGQPHFNSNQQLDSLSGEVQHPKEQLNGPTTMQQQQLPVYQTAAGSTLIQSNNAEGGIVMATNLLQLSRNEEQSNAQQVPDMLWAGYSRPIIIEPFNDKADTELHHQFEVVSPQSLLDESGEDSSMGENEVLSNDGIQRVRSVNSPHDVNCSDEDDASTLARTHRCDVCKKRFKFKSRLARHSRVHTDEKPYKCVLCHRSFRYSFNLSQHSLIHNGLKPYECDVCHRRFGARRSLPDHYLVFHNPENPFECNICMRRFQQNDQLTHHMRNHRNGPALRSEIFPAVL